MGPSGRGVMLSDQRAYDLSIVMLSRFEGGTEKY